MSNPPYVPERGGGGGGGGGGVGVTIDRCIIKWRHAPLMNHPLEGIRQSGKDFGRRAKGRRVTWHRSRPARPSEFLGGACHPGGRGLRLTRRRFLPSASPRAQTGCHRRDGIHAQTRTTRRKGQGLPRLHPQETTNQ